MITPHQIYSTQTGRRALGHATPAADRPRVFVSTALLTHRLRLSVSDPRTWSREHIHGWLRWAERKFGLPPLDVSSFPGSGAELCRLGRGQLSQLVGRQTARCLRFHLHSLKKRVGLADSASEDEEEEEPTGSEPGSTLSADGGWARGTGTDTGRSRGGIRGGHGTGYQVTGTGEVTGRDTERSRDGVSMYGDVCRWQPAENKMVSNICDMQ